MSGINRQAKCTENNRNIDITRTAPLRCQRALAAVGFCFWLTLLVLVSARFRKWRLLLCAVICRLLVYFAGLFNVNVIDIFVEVQFALTVIY